MRKKASSVTQFLAQVHKAELLVMNSWIFLIVTHQLILIDKLNQWSRVLCHTKTSTWVNISTIAPQKAMKIALKAVAWMDQAMKVLLKTLLQPLLLNNINHLFHQASMVLQCNFSLLLKLKLLMLHALIQAVQSSSQPFNKIQILKTAHLLQRQISLISQKEDGSVLNAKTITLKEETIATDARKIELKKIVKESQSTWVKLSLPKNKRKLLRQKKRDLNKLVWLN